MKVTIRRKKIANNTKYSLILDYYAKNQRKFETLGIHTYIKPKTEAERKHNADKKILAEDIRLKRENELKAAEYDVENVLSKKGNFLDYYKIYVDKYAKKDVRMVKHSHTHFVSFIQKNYAHKSIANVLYLRPSDVKKELCIQFKEYLSNECGLSGETPANYFSRFKKVLKKASDDGVFVKNPADGIINKVDKNTLKKDILTFDELKILYNTPCGNDEVKKSFLVGCYTGLRPSDLYDLKWKNIVGDSIQIEQQKTGVANKIKVGADVLKLLGERGKQEDYLFNLRHENGKIISFNGINKVLKNWVGRTEINKKITAYCSRHTFGTNIYLHSKDIRSASLLLGHTSMEHTTKYVRKVEQLENDAIDKLPSIM